MVARAANQDGRVSAMLVHERLLYVDEDRVGDGEKDALVRWRRRRRCGPPRSRCQVLQELVQVREQHHDERGARRARRGGHGDVRATR